MKRRYDRFPKFGRRLDPNEITKDGYLKDDFIISSEDDDDYNENQNGSEYFDVDSKPIQNDIINSLIDSGLDPSVKTHVRNAFKRTGEKLFQDYTNTKPNNESWKLGLSPLTVKEIEPELKRIRQDIENETPTLYKILQANITFEDKKRCVILFDQLNNIEPFTTEHANKIDEINNIIRKSSKYDVKELEKIEEKLRQNTSCNDNLKNQILTMNAPDNVKSIVYGQYLQMLEHEVGSQAYNSIREEIEWSLRLPHNTSKTTYDLSTMTKEELNAFYTGFLNKLDQKLYGMDNIKLQMLHILNSRKNGNKASGRNIAIVGPPGVGKTTIAKALAEAMGQPCEKISVGGLDDATILKGTDKVWNSSAPSIILQILARIKSSRGVIIFDEIDKLNETPKAKEVQYALLHISDYTHNNEFRDSYLNKYSHDLSGITFVYIMNKIDTLDEALLSRMDVIEAKPYNLDEKKIIIRSYVLPSTLKEVGMKENDVIITDEAINLLALTTSHDPGVREIEKVVKCLIDKVSMYNSVALKDGTVGSLKLPYKIPKFKLPLKIDVKLLKELTKEKIDYK